MDNKNISFKVIKSFDLSLIDIIKKLELENLGKDAALNEWQIPVIIRYGKLISVQEDNSRIIGVCEALRCWQDSATAFIHSFYIVKERRSSGIGIRLLSFAVELFRSENFKKIELTVDPENIAALGLYKKLAFKVIKTEYDEYGKGINRYLMRLTL